MTCGGILLGILAIFFPPGAVIIRRGCGAEVLICIGLLFLGWIPGVVYAWYVILTYPSFRQRRRRRRRSVDGPRQEVVYAGPPRRSGSTTRRRSGQTGYYPPPQPHMSEGRRGRKY